MNKKLFWRQFETDGIILIIISIALIGCVTHTSSQHSTSENPLPLKLDSDFANDFSLRNGKWSSSSPLLLNEPSYEFSENEPISLEKLKQLARQYNPTLIQAWANVEAERAKALQAGLYPNPIIGYTGDQIGVKNTIGEFQGGFIRQEIVTGGKLALSREKYLARASAAEFQALAQEYRIINGILIQYYRLLGIQKQVKIHKELLESYKDNLLTVREMLNVGQANQADIHQANVKLNQQQLRMQHSQNELLVAKEILMSLVGIPLPSAPVSGELIENLPPLDFEQSLQRVLDESPELGMAHANMKSDQIMVKREEAEPIPNINIQFSSGRNYVEQGTVHGVMAFIEVPIFDWNQGAIKQARADLRRQQAQVRLTELQLRQRLAEQFQQYLTALQHVHNYRDFILPESEARYIIQLRSYEAARETWPVVLEAQQDFFMRRVEYVDQLIAWRTARVSIEGMLLTDGLQAPPSVTPPGHIDSTPKPR